MKSPNVIVMLGSSYTDQVGMWLPVEDPREPELVHDFGFTKSYIFNYMSEVEHPGRLLSWHLDVALLMTDVTLKFQIWRPVPSTR